jgi:hypothetical protein
MSAASNLAARTAPDMVVSLRNNPPGAGIAPSNDGRYERPGHGYAREIGGARG